MNSQLLRGAIFAITALISAEAHAGLIQDVQNNVGSRCGNQQVPLSECANYQQLAYNNGNGCITYTEYVFAINNSVAPLCSPFNNHVYIGWCKCGCFEEGTGILMENNDSGEEEIVRVEDIDAESQSHGAMTLSFSANLKRLSSGASPRQGSKDRFGDASASFEDFSFNARPVLSTTTGPEEKPLVVIYTADRRRLAVTEQHAVLVSTGEMLRAVDLTTEHRVVDESGSFVAIDRIDRVHTRFDVHNFLTDAKLNPYGHLIVAEGLVVGDIMWQNSLTKMLGEVIIRQ